MDWREQASCRAFDPALFDPAEDSEHYRGSPARAAMAARVCSDCPVRVQCCLEADTEMFEGVWAGWWRVLRNGQYSRRRIPA